MLCHRVPVLQRLFGFGHNGDGLSCKPAAAVDQHGYVLVPGVFRSEDFIGNRIIQYLQFNFYIFFNVVIYQIYLLQRYNLNSINSTRLCGGS